MCHLSWLKKLSLPMVLGGCVWAEAKFLKPWQVTDKIIEWIFSQFTFNILWVTLTQKIITRRVLKIHKWYWGDVYGQGKFLKPWQVTHKISEWFFSKFTFNFLRVTLTQKIITHRVLKIHKWFWGDVYGQGKFLKPWQVTHKIGEWFFSEFTFNFLQVTLTQKIITRRVLKIHEWIWRGCVWVGESFWNYDKWHIKLLSEFLCKSHSTFYKWL